MSTATHSAGNHAAQLKALLANRVYLTSQNWVKLVALGAFGEVKNQIKESDLPFGEQISDALGKLEPKVSEYASKFGEKINAHVNTAFTKLADKATKSAKDAGNKTTESKGSE